MSVVSTAQVEVRRPARRQPEKGRSRFSNHHDLLPEIVDGRSSAARRFRDLVRGFIADQGGLDCCSETKIVLLRRLAAVTVMAETIEARMVNGEDIDTNKLCVLASVSVRLAQRLGLERHMREVVDPLSYAAEHVSADSELPP